jgi:hypothetical protein
MVLRRSSARTDGFRDEIWMSYRHITDNERYHDNRIGMCED